MHTWIFNCKAKRIPIQDTVILNLLFISTITNNVIKYPIRKYNIMYIHCACASLIVIYKGYTNVMAEVHKGMMWSVYQHCYLITSKFVSKKSIHSRVLTIPFILCPLNQFEGRNNRTACDFEKINV